MFCQYCNAIAARYTNPPLCPVHLDLSILVEWMENHSQPLTVSEAQDLHARCIANSGDWTITAEQIAELLPGYLAATKKAALSTQESAANLVTPAEA
ncbi:MAG: hypothetical protein BroJett011_04440 [Chloroflexota bacterium]|nr:MAG: hypothetical protein BroJett011_04440 [Chloroflexota bacterium]